MNNPETTILTTLDLAFKLSHFGYTKFTICNIHLTNQGIGQNFTTVLKRVICKIISVAYWLINQRFTF